jgi:hypothetical protein
MYGSCDIRMTPHPNVCRVCQLVDLGRVEKPGSRAVGSFMQIPWVQSSQVSNKL